MIYTVHERWSIPCDNESVMEQDNYDHSKLELAIQKTATVFLK